MHGTDVRQLTCSTQRTARHLSNYNYYASPNAASEEFIWDREILDDPNPSIRNTGDDVAT